MPRITIRPFALKIGGTATAVGQFCQYHRLPTEWYSLAKAHPISCNKWEESFVTCGTIRDSVVSNLLETFWHSYFTTPEGVIHLDSTLDYCSIFIVIYNRWMVWFQQAFVIPELCSKRIGIIPGGLMHAVCFQGLSIRPVRCFRGIYPTVCENSITKQAVPCFWAEYAWLFRASGLSCWR